MDMAISLAKHNIPTLPNQESSLKIVRIKLDWQSYGSSGVAADLDVSCFMLTDAGKVRDNDDFVLYNQPKSACGSVKHSGDGNGKELFVHLDTVPADIVKLIFAATIHKFNIKRQDFGVVGKAHVRIFDHGTNEHLASIDLSGDAHQCTAIIFGDLIRQNAGWVFQDATDFKPFSGGLEQIARQFGVAVD